MLIGGTWTRSRVNEGLPRERGVRRSLQGGTVGCLLVQSNNMNIIVLISSSSRSSRSGSSSSSSSSSSLSLIHI